MTLLEINNIAVAEWRSAMLEAFQKGRKKGYVVTHVGVSGTEGKSFLFKPLHGVFGDEHLFIAPAKGNFPLMGPPSLDKARAALLDDWRFNEDILSYNLQLLWYEGAPLVIARPQNEHSGHLRYAKDDPVFITTLEADLLSAKKNVKDGDVSMMLKRLRVFRFVTPLANVDDTLVACPHCFAKFLLFGPETGMTPRGEGGSPKRSAEATTRTAGGRVDRGGGCRFPARHRAWAPGGEDPGERRRREASRIPGCRHARGVSGDQEAPGAQDHPAAPVRSLSESETPRGRWLKRSLQREGSFKGYC